MNKLIVVAALAAFVAGCGGEYMLTVPDTVTVAGGDAPVVVRLQQKEFWRHTPAQADAVVRLWVLPEQKRAAYTDEYGYAASAVAVPAQPGRYAVTVCHKTPRGVDVRQLGACYVLKPRRLVVVVDFSAIDTPATARAAAEALDMLGQAGVQVAYASTAMAPRPEKAHQWLTWLGLPDGPVLGWSWRKDWRRRPVEVTGSMRGVRDYVPAMAVAVGYDEEFCRAAEHLNMAAVRLGGAGGPTPGGWADFADRLLAAASLLGEQDFAGRSGEDVGKAIGEPVP